MTSTCSKGNFNTIVGGLRVYVAGPITLGDYMANIRQAILAGERLLSLGFTPYVPHLNYTWHMLYPKTLQQWLALDMEWLFQCHCLLRLPGPSVGADFEVQYAQAHDIPVFTEIDDLIMYRRQYSHSRNMS
jgi:hypothetical protein